MAAPCINDTCSITSSIDPVTRRLALDVILNPSGGLFCDNGLGINLLGDPAPAAASAAVDFMQLLLTPGGELWSAPKGAQISTFASSVVSIPSDGQESGGANGVSAGTVTNPFNASAMVMVLGRFQIGWTIEGVAEAQSLSTDSNIGWVPYAAEVTSRFKVDNINRDAAQHSISGVWLTDKQPHNGRDWRDFAWVGNIGPGDTLDFAASGALVVPTSPAGYPYNLDFSAGPSFVDRGFQVTGQAIVLPFGVQ